MARVAANLVWALCCTAIGHRCWHAYVQGFVVGFRGAQVFCLHYNSMQAIEVPQSASMHGYLAAEDWDSAYKVCSTQ